MPKKKSPKPIDPKKLRVECSVNPMNPLMGFLYKNKQGKVLEVSRLREAKEYAKANGYTGIKIVYV